MDEFQLLAIHLFQGLREPIHFLKGRLSAIKYCKKVFFSEASITTKLINRKVSHRLHNFRFVP